MSISLNGHTHSSELFTKYNEFVLQASQCGLTKEQIHLHLSTVEGKLTSWKSQKKNQYIKKATLQGLALTIEYDPDKQEIYTHFKSKTARVGKGLFSKVTLSISVQTGKKLANKTLRKDESSCTSAVRKQRHLEEGRAHLFFHDCPNVVKAYHFSECGLLLEHMSNGSLHKYLKKNFASLSFTQKQQIARGAINGMQQMHQKGFIHGDIKVENIMLDEHLVAKIGDLGTLSRIGERLTPRLGNALGRPPETWHKWVKEEYHHYQVEDDMWAMGIVLYELEYGLGPGLPFEEEMNVLFHACQARDRRLPPDTTTPLDTLYLQLVTKIETSVSALTPRPNSFISVIKGLLSTDPKVRKATVKAFTEPDEKG